MIDLSIILPSIRIDRLENVYNSITESCKLHSFELIIIGPYYPELIFNKSNVRYIKDFGTPTRCAQIGAILAEGRLLTWGSDDATWLPNTLDNSIKITETHYCNYVAIRYGEGHGAPMPKELHNARAHGDCQLPGVLDHYKVAPVGILNTAYFRFLGGWDCRYEHLNMCCHDLVFRIQNNGGEIIIPDFPTFNCDWMPGQDGDHAPIHFAYFENDLPLWKEMYAEPHPDRIEIDINNWRQSPPVWKRRFN